VRDDAAMLLPPWWAAALSGREREVVALIARGMPGAGIAQRVVLSPLTAETHASHGGRRPRPAGGPGLSVRAGGASRQG